VSEVSYATPNGIALITGASAGIGSVYADRLARRGHDLLLVARDTGKLNNIAVRLRAETGVAVEILPTDLTAKPDLARVEARLREQEGISILVNNAGILVNGGLVDADPDRLEAMILLNVVAASRLAIAAATSFAHRRHGLIINVGSISALIPERSSNGVYSGSKAFLLNLTQSLNAELVPSNVRVQAVLPGATRTELYQRSGLDIASLPAHMVMDVNEMVDAALAGLLQGELVTLPSLPDPADWEAFVAARHALRPNLTKGRAAGRFKVGEK
jgi:short-subunit dehydrogenase